jgi:gliding motility-associated-like protein
MYPDTGTYNVLLTITDTNGCFDTISHRIEIEPDYIFFLPNTFTPNEDGINELFIPLSTGLNEASYHFYIFTRWGDAIFHTEDITVGWNGLANNGKKLAQTGVYVWLVLSKDLTGVNHQYTGHVTLMR